MINILSLMELLPRTSVTRLARFDALPDCVSPQPYGRFLAPDVGVENGLSNRASRHFRLTLYNMTSSVLQKEPHRC